MNGDDPLTLFALGYKTGILRYKAVQPFLNKPEWMLREWIKNLAESISNSYRDFHMNLKEDDYHAAHSDWVWVWYCVGELCAYLDIMSLWEGKVK